MEMRKTLKTLFFMVWALLLIVACVSQAEPMGSAFTYQGRLMDGNSPANGLYDLQFKLYDSPSDGNQLASIIDINELDVLDGYLTVLLDFGSDVFIGNACWLEMGVRAGELNDPNAYTTLIPRQQITPTPYALGYLNPLLGLETAFSSATGNTFYGYGAGLSNTTGNYNTFLGYYAGNKNTTGSWNTFSGTYAGYKNTTANYNTFSGYAAGYSNTTGYSNIFSGYRAGYSNTTGGYNTFSGYGAGCYNTTGNSNTFSGYAAGYLNTTGRQNTFSGTCAGYSNTTGQQNTFSGYQAGYSNTTGNWNTFSGYAAGYSNTTGYGNTFSGRYAGYSNTTGNGNVFIGYQAGYFETGSKKLYIANGPADANVLIYGDFSTGRVGLGTKTPQGKLDVNGSIYQRGSLLHADYVFEGDYKLESIDEHSKFMWQQKHLAAIPKAQVDENGQEIIEVGAHRRGIVEELEKAHIYIEQLHERINTLEKEKQMMEARLTAIESIVAKLGQSQEGGSKSPVE
jgi:hypothetical protein